MTELTWMEGAIAIEAVLQSGSRKVTAVYQQQGKWKKQTRRLLKLAHQQNIPVEKVSAEFIAERTGGKTHGGIIAEVGPRRFVELGDLLNPNQPSTIIMLDGVEDPFNYGQAIRSLYAAGVDGVVVRPRNWLTAVSVVARSSAGASELMPMAVAETAEIAAEFYRANGLTIACTTDKQAIPLYTADLTQPLFLLIGGEKRGITRSFMDQADLRLQIPYGRDFRRSLGATAATAVIGFEILRQKQV